MVLAAEVGGRWSVETAKKSLDSPHVLQGSTGLHQEVERSSGLLSCARVLCFVAGPPQCLVSGSSLQCMMWCVMPGVSE